MKKLLGIIVLGLLLSGNAYAKPVLLECVADDPPDPDEISFDYLSLDIEGMDYEVLINLDFNKFNIKNISFEHLHLNLWQKIKIIFKLVKNGYFFSGMGFDIRKSDWMFTKDYRSKIMLTYLLPITPRRIWKKYSFSKQI